jgi:hypothetical protein
MSFFPIQHFCSISHKFVWCQFYLEKFDILWQIFWVPNLWFFLTIWTSIAISLVSFFFFFFYKNDVKGKPFHPVSFWPGWTSSTYTTSTFTFF